MDPSHALSASIGAEFLLLQNLREQECGPRSWLLLVVDICSGDRRLRQTRTQHARRAASLREVTRSSFFGCKYLITSPFPRSYVGL